MIKVITPVGMSVFENYIKENDNIIFRNAYIPIKENKYRADDLNKENNRRKVIENTLNEKWFRNNINASAEIKSLIKLKEQLQEDFDIYLLYSDTAISRLAAEILQRVVTYYESLKKSEIRIQKIEGLQIWNKEEFIKGITNLVRTIYNIAKEYWENIIINITGGYKATIPYLTLLGQINRCSIYYIFEDTDTLIKIPYLPIDIKWDLFDEYWEYIEKVEHPKIHPKDDLPYCFLENLKSLVIEEKINGKTYVSLNPLGEILWEKYKSRYFIFYSPQDVYEDIEKQAYIREIITTKFYKKEIRENKTQTKNNHRVYDDGNNPYRIFYFEEDNKIYIYKTFESHDNYEDYLNKYPFNDNLKNQIIRTSKLYKKEVKNV
jgi:putative CRISPR-associated protein (TIGR02619 family)